MKNNKTLRQQSAILNETVVQRDDDNPTLKTTTNVYPQPGFNHEPQMNHETIIFSILWW